MANFKVHFNTGAIVSGVVSSTLFALGIVSPVQSTIYLSLGIIGAILPDIDINNSIPLKIGFRLLGLIFAFLVLFTVGVHYSVIEMIFIWIMTFVFIRYIVLMLFNKFTTHRGIFHSIPAGVLFCLIFVVLLYHIFKFHHFHSWLGGFMIFIGYMTHLILDEVYSVDFSGRKLKKSFGTAIKLYDKKNLNSSLYMYASIAFVFLFVPSFYDFFYVLTNSKFYENISFVLIPSGEWFKDLF